MSNTLVIHPDDRSTDFLKLIYKNKNYDIINDCDISKEYLISQILNHDRIIMMGHGVSSGLLNPKNFNLLIDHSFADILKEKDTISIWCWSDQYFRLHNIPGFHTGVIISETSEELSMLGYISLNKEELLDNMNFMSQKFNECIDKSSQEIRDYMIKNYNRGDDVSKFNRSKMFVLE